MALVTLQGCRDSSIVQSEERRPVLKNYWKLNRLSEVTPLSDKAHNKMVYLRVIGTISALFAGAIYGLGLAAIAVYGSTYLIATGVLASSLSFLWASRIQSEEDNRELNELQAKIKDFSLADVLECFELGDIFAMGILPPPQFVSLYRAHVQSLPISEVCDFYEETLAQLKATKKPKFMYYIPNPIELKDKWDSETRDKRFDQIISEYPIEKLKKYKVFNTYELNILEKLIKTYSDARKESEPVFKEIVEDLNRQYDLYRSKKAII